ncbi:hypothetical protein Tco_0654118 [Tanacetum coccineum]|uniref:Uncharacterized protein n=1 Tax=Tanacetum coccineum TaxID=301880 RepID=A0ABQ4X2F0_9ASTR
MAVIRYHVEAATESAGAGGLLTHPHPRLRPPPHHLSPISKIRLGNIILCESACGVWTAVFQPATGLIWQEQKVKWWVWEAAARTPKGQVCSQVMLEPDKQAISKHMGSYWHHLMGRSIDSVSQCLNVPQLEWILMYVTDRHAQES